MQHGAYTVETAIRGIAQVALAGAPAIVRVPVGGYATASRMLDAGAAGVIAPMKLPRGRTRIRLVRQVPADR